MQPPFEMISPTLLISLVNIWLWLLSYSCCCCCCCPLNFNCARKIPKKFRKIVVSSYRSETVSFDACSCSVLSPLWWMQLRLMTLRHWRRKGSVYVGDGRTTTDNNWQLHLNYGQMTRQLEADQKIIGNEYNKNHVLKSLLKSRTPHKKLDVIKRLQVEKLSKIF